MAAKQSVQKRLQRHDEEQKAQEVDKGLSLDNVPAENHVEEQEITQLVEEEEDAEQTILIPLGCLDSGANDRPTHLDVHLSRDQSRALWLLTDGCRKQHRTLESGRHVESKPDAIKWLLEQGSRHRSRERQ